MNIQQTPYITKKPVYLTIVNDTGYFICMHKYIWPSDVSKAARWYLGMFKELSREMSLDNLLEYLDKDAPPRKTVYANLQRLVNHGFITRSGTGHTISYEINKHGLDYLQQLSMFNIEAPESWDHHWRIVLFDVPEHSRLARNQIRRLLKELGFVQLQLSAWIHPFPCLEQFDQLRNAYGIEEHIHLIETNNFLAPISFMMHFQSRYPEFNFKNPSA